MKNVIGFLVVFQLIVGTVAFGLEAETTCPAGDQSARDAAPAPKAPATEKPVVEKPASEVAPR